MAIDSGFFPWKMVIFHSDVKLPEGIFVWTLEKHGEICWVAPVWQSQSPSCCRSSPAPRLSHADKDLDGMRIDENCGARNRMKIVKSYGEFTPVHTMAGKDSDRIPGISGAPLQLVQLALLSVLVESRPVTNCKQEKAGLEAKNIVSYHVFTISQALAATSWSRSSTWKRLVRSKVSWNALGLINSWWLLCIHQKGTNDRIRSSL